MWVTAFVMVMWCSTMEVWLCDSVCVCVCVEAGGLGCERSRDLRWVWDIDINEEVYNKIIIKMII